MLVRSVGTEILNNVADVLLGKPESIRLCVAALLAGGHILIEDVPGVGKTILARSLAISIGAAFRRVQFTSDLLPGDLVGVQIFNQINHEFEFHPGPVMTQVLLADEINRASPRTQAALLECMEEHAVTVDGTTYELSRPFIVLATQNPIEFEGTYPLPESQLDRFMISLRLGYPSRLHELRMLSDQETAHPIDALRSVTTPENLVSWQDERARVYVDHQIRHYILDLIDGTRTHPEVELGASPRASLALFQMSQASALLEGRDFVIPDDVKRVTIAVLRHRVILTATHGGASGAERFLQGLLDSTPVPGNGR